MTLYPALEWAIVTKVARICTAIFFKGNIYRMIRQQLGEFYLNSVSAQFKTDSCSAFCSGQLALITVMQFAEQLTDRQAADAVRSRSDWKYALGLKLTHPKFDSLLLNEFRQRLTAGGRESLLLDELLKQFQQRGWLKTKVQAKTDSTYVLETIRLLNQTEYVGETLRRALNHLAIAAPEWLLAQVSPDWFDRYGTLFEQYHLPKEKTGLQQLKLTIGSDSYHLLSMLDALHTPEELRQLASVKILRSIWIQQSCFEGEENI